MLTNWLYPKKKINSSYFFDKGLVSWSQAPVEFMVLPPHKNWEIGSQGAISLDSLSRRWLPDLWERHLRFKNWQNVLFSFFFKFTYVLKSKRKINNNFLKKNVPKKKEGEKRSICLYQGKFSLKYSSMCIFLYSYNII